MPTTKGVEVDFHVFATVYDSSASSITAPGDQALRALETTFEGHRTAFPDLTREELHLSLIHI